MTADARKQAQRLVSGFRGYQLVAAACKLKLPDLLAAGPMTADELAAATGTHPPSLRRMLRGLAAWEVLMEDADGRFAATPLSDMFRSDRPGLRNAAINLSEEGYTVWGELMEVLKTGRPAYERVYGKPRWEHLAENPAASARFNAAMVETSNRVGAAFAAAYDFGTARTVVDVGGGNGALLAAVLRAHPGMKGVLFDQAAGLAGARENLQASDVHDRITLVEGSFFESVPAGGDVYLLKSIVHDWDDERAARILKACRQGMNATSRIVLIERPLPERIDDPAEALPTVMLDLHMLVVFGARERTQSEYAHLLAGAGMRLTSRIPMDSDFAAYEGVPV